VDRAAAILNEATNPIVLAGHGAARADAGAALIRFAERLGVSVATTFHGKGVFPDDHPQALGAIGFMRHDYVNFGFDQADAIVTVGYELQEFDPVRINPQGDKQIIHIHRFPAEVDLHYNVSVGLQADISRCLDALAAALDCNFEDQTAKLEIRRLLAQEFDQGSRDERFPMAPARIVSDIRAAMGRDDIVLVDTGALKMWMARLYPTYEPNTCLMSNGLSTMAWSLPGALGAKIARPDAKVLVATGDGGFLMNSQEIETALRERIPMVILIWVDNAYGLISWKMDLEIGHDVDTTFGNPDFVAYARSFGAAGYEITSPEELLPTLQAALAEDTVSVIACPVDYSANGELIRSLGALDESLS
jgi:acetolactate synthase-1/2/3 large subunit